MGWEQHVVSCVEAHDAGLAESPDGFCSASRQPRDECTTIVCRDGETVAWVSHAPSADDVKQRANPDIPLLS